MTRNSDTRAIRAPRNRTITVGESETAAFPDVVVRDYRVGDLDRNLVVCTDAFTLLSKLKPESFDLLVADPPYNLTKTFGKEKFISTTSDEYEGWLDSWLQLCAPLLKSTASVYICGDWRSSSAIQRAGS